MTAEFTEHLAEYLAARDHERDDRVSHAIGALTAREQVLVREAAVMGYVQGALSTGGSVLGEQIPADSAILRRVVAACQAVPELYPMLGKVTR